MARRILRQGKEILREARAPRRRDTRTNLTKLNAPALIDRDGKAALEPQFVNGKWRKPRISGRRAAELRKTAILNGTYGEAGNSWKPSWDVRRKPRVAMPPKGSLDKRKKAERIAIIEANLADMDSKITKHRKLETERKPKSFLEKLLQQSDVGKP